MDYELSALVKRVEARRDAIIAAMSRRPARAADWPESALDTGPVPDEPTAESAGAFLDAALSWLRDRDLAAVVSWLSSPGPSGLVRFVSVACADIGRIAREVLGSSSDAVSEVEDRIDDLVEAVSRRVDRLLAREGEAVRELVRHLEASHSLASPLSVMTLQAELAGMRIAGGQPEAAEQHLAQVMAAAERVVEQRQSLGAGTPAWCTDLRRAVKAEREQGAG